FASSPNGLERAAEIAHVVQRVKDAKHVHSVFRRFFHEAIHDGVFIMTIAKQILSAKKHLQPSIRHQFAKRSQPLPRVFIKEADARVVCRASPALDAPIAGAIQVLARRRNILHRHPRGEQALMPVTRGQLGYFHKPRHRFIYSESVSTSLYTPTLSRRSLE